MYAQLRQGGAAGGMVSWRRMFEFLLSICQLYSDIEADTRVGVGLTIEFPALDSCLAPHVRLPAVCQLGAAWAPTLRPTPG